MDYEHADCGATLGEVIAAYAIVIGVIVAMVATAMYGC